MNNIYVDELPKSCFDCDCPYTDDSINNVPLRCPVCAWDWGKQKRDTEVTGYNKSRHKTCPLKPLTDRLAEERKKVVGELKVDIRSLFNSYASSLLDYCIWNKNADENQKLYNNFKRIINDRLDKVLDLFDKRIDQIERGNDVI